MALEHCDDFGSYGTTASFLTDGVYAEKPNVFLVADPDPSGSGTVVQILQGSSLANLRYVLQSGAVTTLGVGMRFYMPALPSDNTYRPSPITFCDANNVAQIELSVNTTGTLSVYRGDTSGTLIATSSAPVLTAAAWHHIEMKVLFSQTVGTIEVRVDGVPVTGLVLTGQDTCATALVECSQIRLSIPAKIGGSPPVYYWRDLVVWNSSGTANNNFMGTVRVLRLVPTSDVALNWTPSTGSTGFDLIDEASPNDDTDYISAPSTLPAAYQAGLTNLPSDVTSVRALMSMVRMKKTDGGDGQVQVGIKATTNTDQGADRAITAAYAYWRDISELDPDTSAAWTPTAVDGAKLVINRTL